MTKTHCTHYARARQDMKFRVAPALLFAISLLTTLGLTEETWGQTDGRRVGVLSFSPANDDPSLQAFLKIIRRSFSDLGWIEGKTVSFEYRSAHDDASQFAAAAEALVGLNVDVILADSAPALRAAYAATRTIPIVASDYTTDPIAEGYVESYARPGGNVTGVFLDAPEFAGKWFELLKAMVPDLSRVAVLWDPGPGANHLHAVRSVAKAFDITLQILEVSKPDDIERAFTALRGHPQAVIILPSPMNYGQSLRLARLTLKHRLPATSMARDFAIAGGAIAYGPETTSADKRIADLVAKILEGADPAELPVERPTEIKLVVNLKTAKSLGITIPQSIRLRADEVIR